MLGDIGGDNDMLEKSASRSSVVVLEQAVVLGRMLAMVLSGRAKIWLVTSCRRSWSVNSCLTFWCKGEAGEIIGERFWDCWGRLKSADKKLWKRGKA